MRRTRACFVAATTLTALAACVSSSPSGDASGGPFDMPFECKTLTSYGEPVPGSAALALLRTAMSVDALDERLVTWPVRPGIDAGPMPSARAGTPCATAGDVPTCNAAFESLASTESLYPSFYESDYASFAVAGQTSKPGYWLAYTKGDTVAKISNKGELAAILPVVDAPVKALLYAEAAGYRVECNAPWIREEPSGYVLRTSRGHEQRCTRTDVILFVGHDGHTEERDAVGPVRDPCT